MAVRIYINPKQGNKSNSSNISYNIEGLPSGDYRFKLENATHSIILGNNEFIYFTGTQYKGIIDLNIPEDSSDSIITIFATIEKKEDNNYQLYKICPVIYEILEKQVSDVAKNIHISPNFIGYSDTCHIEVVDMPDQRLIFSVNDKRLSVITNPDGHGSLSFKASDILTAHQTSVLKKYPIHLSTKKDNFVSKQFIGTYLNVLPDNIKTSVDTLSVIDDRCLDPAFNPADWSPNEDCFATLTSPEVCALEAVNPPVGISSLTQGIDECSNQKILLEDSCRANVHDSSLLPNGTILHGYFSVDNTIEDIESLEYNKNRIFIVKDTSAIKETTIIANRNVNIAPKGANEDFQLIVDYDVWDALSQFESKTYYVVIYNSKFGYQEFIVNGLSVDPSYGTYIVSLAAGDTQLTVNSWIFCINAVFYLRQDPSIDITNVTKLPFVMSDDESTVLQIVNFSLVSNKNYIGEQNEGLIYIVAEVINNGLSQLYLYSFSIADDTHSQQIITGWRKLTSEFNNTNPCAYVDEASNLHIYWSSDRSDISQIYRTVIGASTISAMNSSLTVLVDKYAQMISNPITSFDYTSEHILITEEDEYDLVPRYVTSQLITTPVWDSRTENSGTFSESASGGTLNNVTISVNPIVDSAIGFVTFDCNGVVGTRFSELNFQISADINIDINQTDSLLNNVTKTTLDNIDIDAIYKEWKSKFVMSISTDFSNMPVYSYNNNSYTLGRQNNIYDRFVPLVGSYVKENDFHIKFIQNDNTVKPFVLGVMLEKSYFKAYNIQSLSEYCDDNNMTFDNCTGYVAEETHTIYTGNAKFVLLLKTDNKDANNNLSLNDSEYLIIREFPNAINITDVNKIDIILNYSKLYYEDVVNILNTARDEKITRFLCSLYMLVNENEVFAESFLTNLNDNYYNFDIGVGVPSGGFYAAERMYPSKMSVYDNVDIDIYYKNIKITSPTYNFNRSLIGLPITLKDELVLYKEDPSNNSVDASEDYYSNDVSISPGDHTLIFDPTNIFEIPITLEGSNKAPYAKLGKFRNMELVWQSNRNRYWNIFYGNDVSKCQPFRFETKITDTTSNSLMPTVESSFSGKRLISWHDNRNGNYDIYAAKSINGYDGSQKTCEVNSSVNFESNFDTCSASFVFTATSSGYYNFTIGFYTDNILTSLFAEINSSDGVEGWKSNGVDFSTACTYQVGVCIGIYLTENEETTIAYTPQPGDVIFDKVLYTKLTFLVS